VSHEDAAGPDAELDRVAALGEPVRRALYRYVVAQPEPVTRDQAAAGVGLARHVAKFHLDKLTADGLLEADYARPAGRRGPGAGRPAKIYRRAEREIAVSLPARRYDLAGRVLAGAVTAAGRSGVPLGAALHDEARDTGRTLGRRIRATLGSRRVGRRAAVRAVTDTLSEQGFEPRPEGPAITLANCPFHALAQDYTALVCGMNLDLIEGLVAEIPESGLCAALRPAANRCCVVLAARSAS
jgi:predicted ArsR family transcriptional regulator